MLPSLVGRRVLPGLSSFSYLFFLLPATPRLTTTTTSPCSCLRISSLRLFLLLSLKSSTSSSSTLCQPKPGLLASILSTYPPNPTTSRRFDIIANGRRIFSRPLSSSSSKTRRSWTGEQQRFGRSPGLPLRRRRSPSSGTSTFLLESSPRRFHPSSWSPDFRFVLIVVGFETFEHHVAVGGESSSEEQRLGGVQRRWKWECEWERDWESGEDEGGTSEGWWEWEWWRRRVRDVRYWCFRFRCCCSVAEESSCQTKWGFRYRGCGSYF